MAMRFARARDEVTPWRVLLAGVAMMLIGLLLLDCTGAVAKILGRHYPAQEIALARNLFGLVPTFMILLWEGRGRLRLGAFYLRQWPLAAARGLMVALAQLALYHSYKFLELASVATIAYAAPLFITLLAIPWLGERVGLWRWVAVVGGFAGVVMVIGPGSDVFTWQAVLPAVAAFFYANALVMTRRFDSTASHAAMILYSQSGAILGSFLLLITTATPVWPKGDGAAVLGDLGFAFLLGGFGGFGVYLLTLAYRRTPASLLAPFEYLGVISALAVGWIVFREWPIDRIFPGVLLIVGAGLVIVYRERWAGRRSGLEPAAPKSP